MNSLSSSTTPLRVNENYSKDPANLVTINEKVNLTKDQHEVLNIICKTYQIRFHLYIKQTAIGNTNITCNTPI
jgi:hypothetical protein